MAIVSNAIKSATAKDSLDVGSLIALLTMGDSARLRSIHSYNCEDWTVTHYRGDGIAVNVATLALDGIVFTHLLSVSLSGVPQPMIAGASATPESLVSCLKAWGEVE